MATRADRDIKAIGEAIRDEREERGWSQQMLAQEAGVAVSTVANWESGRSRGPRYEELERLCELFGWALPAGARSNATRVYLNASLARDLVNRPDALFRTRQRSDSDEFLEAVR